MAFELGFEGDARLGHSEMVHEIFVGRYDSLITDPENTESQRGLGQTSDLVSGMLTRRSIH